MRSGMRSLWGTRRTPWAVLAASLIVSGMLVIGSQPTGATTTKAVTAVCRGADSESAGILGGLAPGGTLETPLSVTTEAPAFVEPGQTDVPVSIIWSLNMSADLVDKAAGFGLTSMGVKNAKVDADVSGPTSTTVIPGRPADRTVTLVKGQPFVSQFEPFAGVLKDIGNAGVIKITTTKISFSIGIGAPLNKDLNLSCDTGATLAAIPVKVAGSPNITQPIELDSVEGQSVSVDVLGKYVTAGTDKSGVVREVQADSLKVVEGKATVQDGKIVAIGPAAGTSADVTFEVCAGTVEVAAATPGTDEVQTVRLFEDPNNGFRKHFATSFKLGGSEPGLPVWMVAPNPILSVGFGPVPKPWPEWIGNNPLAWGLPYEAPSEAEMKAAIGSIPGVGLDNVEVTRGERTKLEGSNTYYYRDYQVTFVNGMGKKDVPDLASAHDATWFPQEALAQILAAAGSLSGGGGEPKPKKWPIPEGYTAKTYLEKLDQEIKTLNYQGNYLGALNLFLTEYVGVLGENIMDLIDVTAVLQFITDLFHKPPTYARATQGAEPTAAEVQELCSQGVITLKSASVQGATTTTTATTNTSGAPMSITG